MSNIAKQGSPEPQEEIKEIKPLKMTRCNVCQRKCNAWLFTCNGCKKDFCNQHRLFEDHKCQFIDKHKADLKETLRRSLMKIEDDLKDISHKKNYVRMP